MFLARKLPPCKALVPLVSDACERSLTMREKITLKLHLITCEACRRYVAQIEKMSEIVKPNIEKITASKPADKLSDDARNRIKAAIQAARNKN